VGSGDVLASSGHTIATLGCDEQIACSLTFIDARTGQHRATDVGAGYGQAVFSPDGHTLVFYGGYEAIRADVEIVDVDTGDSQKIEDESFAFNSSPPAFSPDGRWLFTINGPDVHATRLEDGSVVVIPLQGRAQGLNQLTALP
jgi:WD40 repeat protein